MAYAIIKTGGRQYRVAEGDTIDVDLLDVEAGKTAAFGDVLMFSDGKDLTHGNPLIPGARVTAKTSKNAGFNGTFSNTFGGGYVILDGFGFIDAVKAASFIR